MMRAVFSGHVTRKFEQCDHHLHACHSSENAWQRRREEVTENAWEKNSIVLLSLVVVAAVGLQTSD